MVDNMYRLKLWFKTRNISNPFGFTCTKAINKNISIEKMHHNIGVSMKKESRIDTHNAIKLNKFST